MLIGVRWVVYKMKKWVGMSIASLSLTNMRNRRCILPGLHPDQVELLLTQHYYLWDFCYFANIVLLIQLWLLPKSALLNKARDCCEWPNRSLHHRHRA